MLDPSLLEIDQNSFELVVLLGCLFCQYSHLTQRLTKQCSVDTQFPISYMGCSCRVAVRLVDVAVLKVRSPADIAFVHLGKMKKLEMLNAYSASTVAAVAWWMFEESQSMCLLERRGCNGD
jgi:hypothetical protein